MATATGSTGTAIPPGGPGYTNIASTNPGDPGGYYSVATTNTPSSSLSGLLSATGLSSGATTTGAAPGADPNLQINPGAIPPSVAAADPTAANAATFASAKDQAGETGRSTIDSMNGLLGAAGMLGGGAQAAGTLAAVEQAAQGSNDVTRQNAVSDVATNNAIAQTNQAAQLTERGQDISAEQAQAQLAMEQAQLNSQRQLAVLQAALGFTESASAGGAGAPAGSSALY